MIEGLLYGGYSSCNSPSFFEKESQLFALFIDRVLGY